VDGPAAWSSSAPPVAFTPDVTWSLLAVALGLVGTVAVLAERRVR
jgi:hypothetical protein